MPESFIAVGEQNDQVSLFIRRLLEALVASLTNSGSIIQRMSKIR